MCLGIYIVFSYILSSAHIQVLSQISTLRADYIFVLYITLPGAVHIALIFYSVRSAWRLSAPLGCAAFPTRSHRTFELRGSASYSRGNYAFDPLPCRYTVDTDRKRPAFSRRIQLKADSSNLTRSLDFLQLFT